MGRDRAAVTTKPEPTSRAPGGATAVRPRDHRTKLLWRAGEEQHYGLVVDEAAVATLSEPERAVLAYFAAIIGTECEARPLRCRLTQALELGTQCGEKHARVLAEWFPANMPARCDTTPMTAFERAAYGELTLTTRGRRHEVTYEAAYTLGPGQTTWSWAETVVFEAAEGGGELVITSRRVTEGALPPDAVWAGPR